MLPYRHPPPRAISFAREHGHHVLDACPHSAQPREPRTAFAQPLGRSLHGPMLEAQPYPLSSHRERLEAYLKVHVRYDYMSLPYLIQ